MALIHSEASKLLVEIVHAILLRLGSDVVFAAETEEMEVEELHLSIDHEAFLLEAVHLLLNFIHVALVQFLEHEFEDVHLQ